MQQIQIQVQMKIQIQTQMQIQTHLQQSGVNTVDQVFLLNIKVLLIQSTLERFYVSGLV